MTLEGAGPHLKQRGLVPSEQSEECRWVSIGGGGRSPAAGPPGLASFEGK